MTPAPDREQVWQPTWPLALARPLRGLRRGAGDPTYRIVGDTHWLAARTPEGEATVALRQPEGRGGEVLGQGWGAGADWMLARVPDLLGDADDPSGFDPLVPLVSDLLRGRSAPRYGRTLRVWDALMPAILEQKVTGQEAFAGFRAVVRTHGAQAPGVGESLDLWLPPSPRTVAGIPSWSWLQMHVDRSRSLTIVRAARFADSLERLTTLAGPGAGDEAEKRLRTLPGIGEWTAAEVRQRALGDPDAVSFGDYHVAQQVGWAVRGSDMTDEEMREFLAPWRGHRNRVVSLLLSHGTPRPRRGPRMAPRTHLPARTPGRRR